MQQVEHQTNWRDLLGLLKTKEGLYTLFLTLVWGSGILRFLKFMVAHVSILEFLEPYFHVLLLILFSMVVIHQIIGHLQSRDLFFCVACLIIFFSHFLLFPENTSILFEYIYVFPIFTLPFFLWGLQMDIEELDQYFKPISYLNVFLYFIYSFVYLQYKFAGGPMDTEYFMRESYIVLPYVTYVSWCTFRHFSIKDIIFTLLGIFLLFSYGTRGPIVCLLAFILLYYLLVTDSNYKILASVLLVGVGVALWVYAEAILGFFIEFMPKIGMSNRVFMSIANNAFANYENSSDRDIIISKLLLALEESGPFGYGLCGTWRISDGYAHNFVLDILISFGTPLGWTLIFGLLFFLLKAYRACSSKVEQGFFIILFCTGFLKLFISNFFLREPMFWMLIGYSLFLIRKHKALLQS